MKLGIQLLLTILLGMSLLCPQETHAQEDTTHQQKVLVKMLSGVERIGVILSDDGREILLETQDLGRIYIPKSEIESISKVGDEDVYEVGGDLRVTGPFTTRYQFTTNALSIKKGENYAMVNLYGPEVHFALSDRFSLGVMSSWIASPLVLAAKYTIPTKNEKVNLGLGTLIGTSGYLNSFRGYGGLHWGMITFGDRMNSITISGGFSYVQAGFRERSYEIPGTYYSDTTQGYYYPEIPREERRPHIVLAPVASISAIKRVGRKASFIFDSMVFFSSQEDEDRDSQEVRGPEDEWGYAPTVSTTITASDKKQIVMYLMPGMRFQQRPDRAFQVALAGLVIIDHGTVQAFPAPMVSWFFKF